eukprot:m.466540 g.466540  ORF g.466540 m.466540 type:complete len:58 (+) comp25308_c0_seq1:46-219(+)
MSTSHLPETPSNLLKVYGGQVVVARESERRHRSRPAMVHVPFIRLQVAHSKSAENLT